MEKKINIFLIDDSPVALQVLGKILSSEPNFNVVYKATSGEEALRYIPQMKPDLICMDYFMPKMKGPDLVKEILLLCRTPILVISGLISGKDSREIFETLQAGALDFVPKPSTIDPHSEESKRLLEKVRVLSKVFVTTRPLKSQEPSKSVQKWKPGEFDLIAIGTSTGGPTALQTLLKGLPKNFRTPIAVVQHISKGFLESYVAWLASQCELQFKIVEKNQIIEPGCVYFACEGKHLKANSLHELTVEKGVPSDRHCPSVDVLMKSVAEKFHSRAMGIILTGMGSDGARGILAINQEGGVTIAQSKESCVVFGMPQEAIELGGIQQILDLNKIHYLLLSTSQKANV